MTFKDIHKDAFNLLCGDLIASGAFRKVYECRLRPELVVKVEVDEGWRQFHNVYEAQFWSDYRNHRVIGKWIAPIRYVSPDSRIVLMDRCLPIRDDELPERVPDCFHDVKPANFGRLPSGVIVCVDYALTKGTAPAKLVKHDWKPAT